jgi:chromosome segregation ATPase
MKELENKNSEVTALEEKLKQGDRDRKEMEAMISGQITVLEGNVNQSEEKVNQSESEKKEMEAMLRGQITVLDDKVKQSDREREEIEAKLRGQRKEVKTKGDYPEDKERM